MINILISCVDAPAGVAVLQALRHIPGVAHYYSYDTTGKVCVGGSSAFAYNSLEEDDSEEWAMTEYEFREWYYTHSHKQTMAFYNFYMDDFGGFRKISPKVVERELYLLWKENPQLFTDMIGDFDFDEDVDDYTYC